MNENKSSFASTLEALPAQHRAIMVIVTTMVASFIAGLALAGWSKLPDTVRLNTQVNISQDSTLILLKQADRALHRRDTIIEARIERLTCLMEADFNKSNPARCSF